MAKTKKVRKNKDGLIFETYVCEDLYTTGFELKMYDSQESMNKAITRWYRHQQTDYKDDEVLGCFCAARTLEEVSHNDREILIFGTMFMCNEHVDINTIAHESLHAAIACERRVTRYEGLYGDEDTTGYNPEERLAYRVGTYTSSIALACEEHNITLVVDKEKNDE